MLGYIALGWRAGSERAAGTKQVWRGAGEALLDRYTRQRRPIAVNHVDAQSKRNKAFLEERDPAVRRGRLDEIRRIAEHPKAACLYVRQTAMIDSLRQAAALT